MLTFAIACRLFCTPPPPVAPDCPAAKLHFTQATGCQNDGSVELCLPDNPTARAAATAIAPGLRCGTGGGRAGCNQPGLLLCSLETAAAQCVERHGAMTDATWIRVCKLAALPAVKAIVPTWYE